MTNTEKLARAYRLPNPTSPEHLEGRFSGLDGPAAGIVSDKTVYHEKAMLSIMHDPGRTPFTKQRNEKNTKNLLT